MKTAILVLVALASSGCLHMHHSDQVMMLTPASNAGRCATLDRRVTALHIAGIGGGVLGGAATTGAGLAKGENNTAYYSLIGVAIFFSAVGTASGSISTYEATLYTKEKCQ